MPEEPKKPSLPPGDRRAALARALTGSPSVRPPSSSPPRASPSSPAFPSSVPPPSVRTAAAPVPGSGPPAAPLVPSSGRQAVLARRREAALDPRTPGAPRPADPDEVPASKPRPRRSRPAFLVLGALLVCVVLGAAGLWALEGRQKGSPEARVRETLVTWEFSPASGREAVFVELDGMGPSVLPRVIELLGDAAIAERSGSRSSRSIREIAHRYLMRVASSHKVAPPKQAEDVAQSLFASSTAPDAQWAAAQQAWRAWLETQQAKGTIARP